MFSIIVHKNITVYKSHTSPSTQVQNPEVSSGDIYPTSQVITLVMLLLLTVQNWKVRYLGIL